VISFNPFFSKLKKALGYKKIEMESRAVYRWVMASTSNRYIPPARYLPGQLDRIRQTEFAPLETVLRDFRGDFEVTDGETFGYRVKDVDLIDGVLYASGATRHLKESSSLWPAYRIPPAVPNGTFYESWIGNKWFGSWLMEDCLTYQLTTQFGSATTTARYNRSKHITDYETALSMHPARLERVHFDELVFFNDLPNNEGKRTRANRMREQIVSKASYELHPGVFLLRGSSGEKRVLLNEQEIAEGLMTRRGFKVIDPLKSSVAEIVSECAGARVVMSVEGSQLVHSLVTMPPGAALCVIQPPLRVVSNLKTVTDRQGQIYAFLVAHGSDYEFIADVDEVEWTIDLTIATDA
jgi:hypothetical protein